MVKPDVIKCHGKSKHFFAVSLCGDVVLFGWTILTHSGRATHICVSKLTIDVSDNGLSPGRRQAIIWTNAGLLSFRPLRTNFSENLIKIQQFSSKKMHVKMSSAKWRPSCLGLNVLSSSAEKRCWSMFYGQIHVLWLPGDQGSRAVGLLPDT